MYFSFLHALHALHGEKHFFLKLNYLNSFPSRAMALCASERCLPLPGFFTARPLGIFERPAW